MRPSPSVSSHVSSGASGCFRVNNMMNINAPGVGVSLLCLYCVFYEPRRHETRRARSREMLEPAPRVTATFHAERGA